MAIDPQADIHTLYEPSGPLAAILPGYNERREQIEMAVSVMRALTRGEAGFFEAGTGTGKSLAYLLPAAAYALHRGERVVVATHTISLQEQLVRHDIPLAQALFPGLKSVLVKGWSNYVCRLRLDAQLGAVSEALDFGEDGALSEISEWADKTEDGTRSDLPFAPDERIWSLVCAESDSCLRSDCPYYARCHLFRDRAKMAQAQLLIVNHHLLFADVALRRELGWESEHAVLPPYDAVILDEAHHVEDVATEYLGSSLAELGVEQLFGRLLRRRQGRVRGVFPSLERALQHSPDGVAWLERLPQWLEGMQAANASTDAFFRSVQALFMNRRRATADEKVRLEPAGVDRWREQVSPGAEEAAESVMRVSAALAMGIKALGNPDDPALLNVKGQAESAKRRLATLARTLLDFARPDVRSDVYWVESSGNRPSGIRMKRAPIEVGPSILDWVMHQCKSIIMVSATLAVGGSFHYYRGRLGLEGRTEIAGKLGVREARFDSPFDYREQALLAILSDLPEPNAPGYDEALGASIASIVSASRGRALVLFTSFSSLRAVKACVATELALQGITLLVQGELPRTKLLDIFKQTPRAVLFGTDSFWEGIDVPGEALSVVILTRLPFDVPTDPIAKARSERVQAAGRSPFVEYALPRAVLKLKQGFGRLIRTERDRGVVVICDRRIKTKAYGKTFLSGLPPCRRIEGTSRDLADALTDFLA